MLQFLPLIGAGIAAAGNIIGANQQANAAEDVANTNAQAQERINQRNIEAQERTNATNRWHQDAVNAANWNFTREMFDANAALQREFSQMGIQWRVQDAIKAGLHPLYALSGGGSAFSPVASVAAGEASRDVAPRSEASIAPVPQGQGWARDLGQELSRAMTAYLDPNTRMREELTLKKMAVDIERDQALANFYNSQAARIGQASTQTAAAPDVMTEAETFPYQEVKMPDSLQLSNVDSNFPGRFGVVSPKGATIESADPDAQFVAAGPPRPGFQRFRVTRYMEMLLPVNEEGWSEGIESIPMWMYPMVLRANTDRYGPQFWRLLVQELGGRTGFSRWVSRMSFDERPYATRERGDLGGRR